jgi:hypothetical protein
MIVYIFCKNKESKKFFSRRLLFVRGRAFCKIFTLSLAKILLFLEKQNNQMVLFFFFAIISSCIATSEYSSNKWSEYWNDPSLIATINPWIKVQNVIGEGIGWEGTSESAQQSANHVVISIMGKDEGLDVDVPYAKRPIVVKSISPLKCVIEQGNGDFEDCSMDAETPKTFYTNSFGRVSFSVPLQDQVQTKSNLVLPAIMVQTEYMSSDEW